MKSGFSHLREFESKRLQVQSLVNEFEKNNSFSINKKVYFLSNYTMNGIDAFLRYHLFKKEVKVVTCFSDFNVVMQTLIDPSSSLYSFEADFVVLSLDLRIFIKDFFKNIWDVREVFNAITEILDKVVKNVSIPVIVTDFIEPFMFSGSDRSKNKLDKKVRELNRLMAEFVDSHLDQLFLVELNPILSMVGYYDSIDERQWYKVKSPFKSSFLSSLANQMSAIIGAFCGLSRKCIVLDCDNTLWGGVVGEDGVEGIALDPYHYPGVAFYEFQSFLLNLYNQGVLLAICSKNNEEDVLRVLETHPHSLLRKEHFVCIRANWTNKVQNILDISAALKLGTNNFVFIDDSDVECELVDQHISDIEVIQVPKQPSELSRVWMTENLFFIPKRTLEDTRKQQQYKDNFLRAESASSFHDISSFLNSLQTKVSLHIDEVAHIERISQLTQKTNQFNLRTVRYSISDITNIVESVDHVTFSMYVEDKFGQLGVTNTAIFHLKDNIAFLDTFLMSCRVIQRELEYYFLNCCLEILNRDFAISSVSAEFIPSRKNSVAECFLDSIGFDIVKVESGVKKYFGAISDIKVVHQNHILKIGDMSHE